MHCDEYRHLLDDYIDENLPSRLRAAFGRHVGDCMPCRNQLQRAEAIRLLLSDYGEAAAPLPDDAWFENTLARAAREGARQQRNRWLMTGFGAAVAAGIAALVVSALMLDSPTPLPGADRDDVDRGPDRDGPAPGVITDDRAAPDDVERDEVNDDVDVVVECDDGFEEGEAPRDAATAPCTSSA